MNRMFQTRSVSRTFHIVSGTLRGIALSLAMLGFGTSVSCSDKTSAENIGASQDSILNGVPSTAAQDAVVLIGIYDSGPTFMRCTGTLLAPRLVLTARHCVNAISEGKFSCQADGTQLASLPGAIFGDDFSPQNLSIFVGSSGQLTEATQGMTILHDDSKTLCNHDVALIVLKDPIVGIPIAPVRLTATVTEGEPLTAVGWGLDETENLPTTRQQKPVTISRVGPRTLRLEIMTSA